jgi:hypothetical protein
MALQSYPENLLALPEMKEVINAKTGKIMQRGMMPKVDILALHSCSTFGHQHLWTYVGSTWCLLDLPNLYAQHFGCSARLS